MWHGEPQQRKLPEKSRIYSPMTREVAYRASVVRIEIDCRTSRSWSEIDAVRLIGDP